MLHEKNYYGRYLHPREAALLPCRIAFCLSIMTAVLFVDEAAAQPADAPNVIFFMADDMGYGDIGANNPESKIPTPNIDRLANEGIRFTDAHSPSAICSPTRYGVLTGRFAWRTRLTSGIVPYFQPPLIDPSRLTLPQMLRNNGYATAAIGKWHLGLNISKLDGTGYLRRASGSGDSKTLGDYTAPIEGGPTDYGFDYYFGKPGGSILAFVENDRYVGDVVNGKGVTDWEESEKGPIQLNKALDFIDQHHATNAAQGTNTPFFMYYASHAPHLPLTPANNVNGIPVAGVSAAGPRGDMVVENDVMIGEILDKLDEHGIAEDTLIIVTSDNGALLHGDEDRDRFDHKSNGEWRGLKGDIYEGGHRIPFIARWGDGTADNSTIAPGTGSDETIGLNDMMATLAALVGEEIDGESGEDSENILPLLLGDPHAQPIRKDLVHHSRNGMFAMRQGDWKIVFGNGSGGPTKPVGLPDSLPGLLYNLAENPNEKSDLWDEHPDIVASLTTLMNHYRVSGRSSLCFNGDMNLDGMIDLADWNLLAPNMGVGTTLEEGDFNLDGFVDDDDFQIFNSAFLVMNPGSQLPEPSSLWLMAASGGIVLRRRRKPSLLDPTRLRSVRLS